MSQEDPAEPVVEAPCVEEVAVKVNHGKMNEQNAVVQPLLTGMFTHWFLV